MKYACIFCGSDKIIVRKNTYTCLECGRWYSDPDESDWFGENDDLRWFTDGNVSHIPIDLPC